MSFNENVRAAILRVSGVSDSARSIAQRLGFTEGHSVTASEVTDVEALKAQIGVLNAKISELTLLISSTTSHEEDEELTPEQETQLHAQIEKFKESLGTQPITVIAQVYDEEFFDPFSRRERYEMCTALVNWCQQQKYEVLPLWYKTMVNNGSM